MNTAVKYKRPGRNRYGEYQSLTFIQQDEIVGHIKISLVWFNGLGWYYSVELEGWNNRVIIMEYSKNKDIWKRGKELPLCAQAAEDEARTMCEAHGLIGLNFMPYVLPRSTK